MITEVKKYNPLLFKGKKSEPNIEFHSILKRIKEQYPNDDVIIEYRAEWNEFIGKFCETINLVGSESQAKNELRQLYQTWYHIPALDLYPEYEVEKVREELEKHE